MLLQDKITIWQIRSIYYVIYKLYIIKLGFSVIDQCKFETVRPSLYRKTTRHSDPSPENFKTHAVTAPAAQLITITYATMLQWCKLYYELSGIQRCKNYFYPALAHWAVLRWSFNRPNFVDLLRPAEVLGIVPHLPILRVQCPCSYCTCCPVDNHHICYKALMT